MLNSGFTDTQVHVQFRVCYSVIIIIPYEKLIIKLITQTNFRWPMSAYDDIQQFGKWTSDCALTEWITKNITLCHLFTPLYILLNKKDRVILGMIYSTSVIRYNITWDS